MSRKETKEELIGYLRTMLEIRIFEETIMECFMKVELKGMFHASIGQEAVAVGACASLRKDDYLISHHRGHGHCIAKGADLNRMMAELFGKETGYCRGRAGSMHIADVSLGILGANGIVGAGLPIAVGAGISIKYRGTDQVVLCFFGDGATNQGAFHEALNMASVFKTPVVFLCENNLYALSTSIRFSSPVAHVVNRAAAYSMSAWTVDGMDVLVVKDAVSQAVAQARAGEGPSLVEAKTYRYLGHSKSDVRSYRTREEEEEWKRKDPISTYRSWLIGEGLLSEKEAQILEEEVRKQIAEAVRFARESPEPDPSDVENYIFV